MANILVFSPHPDDFEISIGGIIKILSKDNKVFVVCITRGSESSNGSYKDRQSEARRSDLILGIEERYFLDYLDGSIKISDDKILKELIFYIQKIRPSMIFTPSKLDNHPDHKNSSLLIDNAIYFLGTKKMESDFGSHVCNSIFYFSQDNLNNRGDYQTMFYCDISNVMDDKIDSLNCYSTQLKDEGGTKTYLNMYKIDEIISYNKWLGSQMRSSFGEVVYSNRRIEVTDFSKLILF